MAYIPDVFLLPLLYSSKPVSPSVVRIHYPSQLVTSFLTSWFRDIRSPKQPGGSFNFQFNGIYVMSLHGSFPLFGTKTTGLAEPQFAKMESKNFAIRSLGVIVNEATPISTPWFLDLWLLSVDEKVPHIVLWFRAYTLSWRILPSLWKELSPNWHYN